MAKTPISVLTEYLTQRNQVPTYNLISNGVGTHDPTFIYEVSALGKSAQGKGKSKKEAKHEASRLLFKLISNEEEGKEDAEYVTDQLKSPYAEVIKDNAVGALLEFCQTYHLPDPTYELIRDEGLPHAKIFGYRCSVSTRSFEATSRTKKQAKHSSALGMLNELKSCLPQHLEQIQIPQRSPQLSAEIEEKVKQKIEELGLKKGKQSSSELGLTIENGYQFFKSDNLPVSPTLEYLKKEVDWERKLQEGFGGDEDYTLFNLLTKIVAELEFSLDVMPFRKPKTGNGLVIQVYHPLKISFFGKGANYNEALNDAASRALNFYKIMSS